MKDRIFRIDDDGERFRQRSFAPFILSWRGHILLLLPQNKEAMVD
jgi:hypothetical protein